MFRGFFDLIFNLAMNTTTSTTSYSDNNSKMCISLGQSVEFVFNSWISHSREFFDHVLINHLGEDALQTFWPEAISSVITKAPVCVGERLVTQIVKGLCSINTTVIIKQVDTVSQQLLLH